jgi:hypothetical protein
MSKKLVIDLDNENMVDFNGKLNINEITIMLECLENLQKQFREQLMKMVMLSHIELVREVANRKDMEEPMTIDNLMEYLEENWSKNLDEQKKDLS